MSEKTVYQMVKELQEEVVKIPRKTPLDAVQMEKISTHPAIKEVANRA